MFLFSDRSSEELLFSLTSVQLKRPASAHSHLILSPLHTSEPPHLFFINPGSLAPSETTAHQVFLVFQECWEKRAWPPIQSGLTVPRLIWEQSNQIWNSCT